MSSNNFKGQYLRPDNRGMLQSTSAIIKTGGHITHYRKPNLSLKKIDRLLNQEKPRIAITRRQGGIGDVLMTLPTVKAIARKYNIKVDYGTDFRYLEGALPKVLDGNPYINKTVDWQELKQEDYDALIDLTCPCVTYEVPGVWPCNRIDLFAKHAGVTLQDTNIDYFITPEESKWADNYLDQLNINNPSKKLVLIQLTTTSTFRDGPIDIIKNAFIQALQTDRNICGLLITHNSDLLRYSWDYTGMYHFHNLDVRQIAALISKVNLVFCPDSAILHLASALHQKTLTYFGPTDPRARINYHPEAVAIWPAQHLKNYPIWYAPSTDGYLCWKMLNKDLIAQTILAMVNNTSLPFSTDFITFNKVSINSTKPQIAETL